MHLTPRETSIAGLWVAETKRITDARGSFARLYCSDELDPAVAGRPIVQINQSLTHQIGAIRGLHFQRPPHAEMKIVRCLSGRVWDVAVDLRRGSSTYLRWHAEELSPHNLRMMIIPEGCAHGFQVLEAASELLYLHTAAYAPEAESGVRFDDPSVAISWPLPPTVVSDRDQRLPFITSDFVRL